MPLCFLKKWYNDPKEIPLYLAQTLYARDIYDIYAMLLSFGQIFYILHFNHI